MEKLDNFDENCLLDIFCTHCLSNGVIRVSVDSLSAYIYESFEYRNDPKFLDR